MAMTSCAISNKKDFCETCNKVSGIIKCDGCSKTFCRNCFAIHRKELDQQLDTIEAELKTFPKMIDGSNVDHQSTLMNAIDTWEQKSSLKIQKAAQDAREQVKKWIESNSQDNKIFANEIARQIPQNRSDDAFDEKDLVRWKEQLDELRKLLLKAHLLVNEEQIPSALISNIGVYEQDTFERTCGNANIQDNGQLACHNKNLFGCAGEIRGKREYHTGIHRFRLNIEELGSLPWFFFGIISKSTPMQENSQNSPTAYGWAGHNEVYLNGQCMKGMNGYKSDYQKADVIELILDCDHKLIRMTNLRWTKFYDLAVDLTNCPLPWMLHLNIFHIKTRLRILI